MIHGEIVHLPVEFIEINSIYEKTPRVTIRINRISVYSVQQTGVQIQPGF